MPCSLPSISTKMPTGVSSIAIVTSSCANSSRIFLVAEPDAESELFEHVQQQQAVADDRFHLLAQFHRRVLHRPFEGEKRLSALEADAQHAAAAAQLIVGRVEQIVFLEPPAAQRRRAGCQNRLARFGGIAKTEA